MLEVHAVIRSPADLGLLVRRVRTQRKLSQDELARLLGVTQRYLSELENGKPKLADERFFRILRSMGVVVTASTDGAAPDA
jgi:transcriptional regulator with XRE-family HTH domain